MSELTPPRRPSQSSAELRAPSDDGRNGPGQRRRRRSLFPAGFALGILLMASVSCGGGLYAAGIDANRFAELRGASTAWTPPPTPVVLPTQQAPTDGPGADALYRPGDRPRNVTASFVNIRAAPGYLGKPPDDVVAQAAPGQAVEIVDGPQTSDGLTWWYVRLAQSADAVEGWMAEATAGGVQILGQ